MKSVSLVQQRKNSPHIYSQQHMSFLTKQCSRKYSIRGNLSSHCDSWIVPFFTFYHFMYDYFGVFPCDHSRFSVQLVLFLQKYLRSGCNCLPPVLCRPMLVHHFFVCVWIWGGDWWTEDQTGGERRKRPCQYHFLCHFLNSTVQLNICKANDNEDTHTHRHAHFCYNATITKTVCVG